MVKKKITFGGDGSWDYLTYDEQGHRLFIARSTRVMVVDAVEGKQIGEIPDTAGVHGVALVPELSKGFISAGRANKVVVFDLTSLKTTGTIPVGDNPDAIAFEPVSKRVFTFNGRSKDTTVIDVSGEKVVGTIPLGGKPEFAVANGAGHLFVNIETTGEIAEIDAANLKVVNRWPMQGCEEPTGLALDKEDMLLFSGCSNRVLKVVNVKTGSVVETIPIGDGVDGVGYDPGLGYAYSSNGDGTLTIIGKRNGKWQALNTLLTQKGARTLVVNPVDHLVYSVTAQAKGGERNYEPGTFVLLVMGKE